MKRQFLSVACLSVLLVTLTGPLHAQTTTDAAKADDKVAFDAALASTAASCKGCHDTYQVPPAPPPKAG